MQNLEKIHYGPIVYENYIRNISLCCVACLPIIYNNILGYNRINHDTLE